MVGVKSQTATNLRLAKWRYAPAAVIPADEELYQRQIEATDRQVDGLVCELYGLREEEVGVVEGRLNREGREGERRARKGAAVNGFRERIERIWGGTGSAERGKARRGKGMNRS